MRRDSDFRVLRWVLLAGWIVVVIVGIGWGEHVDSYQDLRHDLVSGRVHDVEVSGGLPPGVHGVATVDLRWRTGIRHHVAEVVQRSSPRPSGGSSSSPRRQVVNGDLVGQLTALQPGLRIEQTGAHYLSDDLRGWSVPGWVVLAGYVLGLMTLGILITGPQPWRATRWAWFWLWGIVPPLGLVAFLLLSGPTPPLRGPRDPTRRLTGGWAFLLSLVFASVLASALTWAMSV